MSSNVVEKLYNEVINFSDKKTIEENIAQRLEKNLKQYLETINNAYDGAITKKNRVVYKEINK